MRGEAKVRKLLSAPTEEKATGIGKVVCGKMCFRELNRMQPPLPNVKGGQGEELKRIC